MDENKVIVSTEMKQVLVNLRNLEEIYVIMSGVTKMPFVLCDDCLLYTSPSPRD